MIEVDNLQRAIDSFHNKMEQGGNLDLEAKKIQKLLEKGEVLLNEWNLAHLQKLNHDIISLKGISENNLRADIVQVFNTSLTYTPDLLKILSNLLLVTLKENNYDMNFELENDGLEKLLALPPEELALYFNEEGVIQLPTNMKIWKMLSKCGDYVNFLNLNSNLTEEAIEEFCSLDLDNALCFCPNLKMLTFENAFAQEKDPLSVIADYCRKIEVLILTDCKSLSIEGLYKIKHKCPSLKHIDLRGCIFIQDQIEKANLVKLLGNTIDILF